MEKLVRDKIPELMEKDGLTPNKRTLMRSERLHWLLLKLQEETSELTATPNLEECADVFEVLTSIATELGFHLDDLLLAASKKWEERGGFADGIVICFDRKPI
jgi:predicted house-cleaning noncanonical NTP pyrophosphatase (MazG superfamily)